MLGIVRSNLHVVSVHDGQKWLTDDLVEGDFGQRVIELLGGIATRTKVLIPNMTHCYYRGDRSVLVMTFKPDVDRAKAEEIMAGLPSHRDDVN